MLTGSYILGVRVCNVFQNPTWLAPTKPPGLLRGAKAQTRRNQPGLHGRNRFQQMVRRQNSLHHHSQEKVHKSLRGSRGSDRAVGGSFMGEYCVRSQPPGSMLLSLSVFLGITQGEKLWYLEFYELIS